MGVDVWVSARPAGTSTALPSRARTSSSPTWTAAERTRWTTARTGRADAIKAGAHVYVEKPCSHNVREGRLMVDAAARNNVVVQVGTQQRSMTHLQKAAEIVKSGQLGKIHKVHLTWNRNANRAARPNLSIDPKTVDWKRFLGNAKDQPFDEYRFRQWRWFWDFGGGHLTDLFSHLGDVVHWYLGEAMPVSAEASGRSFARPDFQCPDTINASFIYPGGYLLTYHGTLSAEEDEALTFFGTGGILRISRAGFNFFQPDHAEPVSKARSTEDGTIPHVTWRQYMDKLTKGEMEKIEPPQHV